MIDFTELQKKLNPEINKQAKQKQEIYDQTKIKTNEEIKYKKWERYKLITIIIGIYVMLIIDIIDLLLE